LDEYHRSLSDYGVDRLEVAIAAAQYGWGEMPLEEQEWDGAAAVADREKYNYRLVAIVADALIVHRPEWVIRASIRQADALIEKPQSIYYPYTADWLRRVKGGLCRDEAQRRVAEISAEA